MINVHASLLPRWRGAAPIQRAVLAGDTETGVTIMRVVQELDAGPMLATRARADRVEADQRRRRARSWPRAARGSSSRSSSALRRARCARNRRTTTGVTYARTITKEDAPSTGGGRPARSTTRCAALNPWPLASTSLEGARLLMVATDAGGEAGAGRRPAGHGLAGARRSLRRRGGPRRRRSLLTREARRQARDDRARVPRRPSGPARHRAWDDCRRRAASRSTRCGRVGAAPICPTRSRARAISCPTSATAPCSAAIVIGTLRWRARLDFHLRRRDARRSTASTPRCSRSCGSASSSCCSSSACPRRPSVDDAVALTRRGGQDAAPAGSSTRSCARSRARAIAWRCRRGPRRSTASDRDGASTALHVTARIRAGWWRAGSTALGLDAADARGSQFNNAEPRR